MPWFQRVIDTSHAPRPSDNRNQRRLIPRFTGLFLVVPMAAATGGKKKATLGLFYFYLAWAGAFLFFFFLFLLLVSLCLPLCLSLSFFSVFLPVTLVPRDYIPDEPLLLLILPRIR